MGARCITSNPVTRILTVVLPVIVCLAFFQADANGFYEKNTLTADYFSIAELEVVIEDCLERTQILNKQIKTVQKDLDWLALKINRISDSGRKVPGQLNASVISKEKKTARLVDEKTRLEKNLAGYQKVYRAKTRKSASKKFDLKSAPVKPIVAETISDVSTQAKISDIAMAVKKAGLEDWVEVLNADSGCARINTTLPILFASGSAALSTEYKPFLKKLARFLKSYEVKIYVSGFADTDPIRTPKYPSNFELGAFRAANIVHEMIRYGLKPGIFKILSTGAYRFAAKNNSPKKSFQRSARVTVIFTG